MAHARDLIPSKVYEEFIFAFDVTLEANTSTATDLFIQYYLKNKPHGKLFAQAISELVIEQIREITALPEAQTKIIDKILKACEPSDYQKYTCAKIQAYTTAVLASDTTISTTVDTATKLIDAIINNTEKEKAIENLIIWINTREKGQNQEAKLSAIINYAMTQAKIETIQEMSAIFVCCPVPTLTKNATAYHTIYHAVYDVFKKTIMDLEKSRLEMIVTQALKSRQQPNLALEELKTILNNAQKTDSYEIRSQIILNHITKNVTTLSPEGINTALLIHEQCTKTETLRIRYEALLTEYTRRTRAIKANEVSNDILTEEAIENLISVDYTLVENATLLPESKKATLAYYLQTIFKKENKENLKKNIMKLDPSQQEVLWRNIAIFDSCNIWNVEDATAASIVDLIDETTSTTSTTITPTSSTPPSAHAMTITVSMDQAQPTTATPSMSPRQQIEEQIQALRSSLNINSINDLNTLKAAVDNFENQLMQIPNLELLKPTGNNSFKITLSNGNSYLVGQEMRDIYLEIKNKTIETLRALRASNQSATFNCPRLFEILNMHMSTGIKGSLALLFGQQTNSIKIAHQENLVPVERTQESNPAHIYQTRF